MSGREYGSYDLLYIVRVPFVSVLQIVSLCVTMLRPRNHRDRTRLVERAWPTRYRGINQSLSILEGMPCGQIRIPTDPLRRRTAVPVNGARSAVGRADYPRDSH